MQQNKLYVGNFPYSVDESQLREMFSSYGQIEDIALIKDRETGRSKGFAFITFATQQGAEMALALNGKDVDGRALKVGEVSTAQVCNRPLTTFQGDLGVVT